jgi:hypothetical protein
VPFLALSKKKLAALVRDLRPGPEAAKIGSLLEMTDNLEGQFKFAGVLDAVNGNV